MIRVNNINVNIGKKNILRNISFQIQPGEIVGLIGPNGAGKTTIMKTILGLLKFNGSVIVDDKRVTEKNHKSLSDNVGALIENPAIYPFLTGLQNLKLYTKNKNDMNIIIEQLKMKSYIKTLSKNYSLGMKQKLGIAIALLNNPSFVILDEPMNGLDVESTILVRKLIKHYAEQGTAFLISSHILSELQKIMTKIMIINNGNLIINKNMHDFQNIKHKYYKLLSNNQQKVKNILKENNIYAGYSSKHIIIKKDDIFIVQKLIYDNGIKLIELYPTNTDFEQLVVNFLQKKAKKNEV